MKPVRQRSIYRSESVDCVRRAPNTQTILLFAAGVAWPHAVSLPASTSRDVLTDILRDDTQRLLAQAVEGDVAKRIDVPNDQLPPNAFEPQHQQPQRQQQQATA